MVTDVVVAHDYLTQRGGAERVALALAEGFSARRVVTSAYAPAQTFDGFAAFDVTTSRHPMVRMLRRDPRRALPFLASAWTHMRPVQADVLICSSSGWAHALGRTPGTAKIVYCHNPARWLYQRDDYTSGTGAGVRAALAALTPSLTRWDRRAAASADAYVANSTSVAARIRRVYGIDAHVVHPPVSVDVDGPRDAVPGLAPGYFLTVGRARGYKGTQTLVNAFAGMPHHRLVIVGTAPDPSHPTNVTALGRVTEAQLRWLYAGARALVSVSHEDFGLTPVEAGAFGTPALVLRAGGFLDTTTEGVSGAFIDGESVDAVRRAVHDFPDTWDADAVRASARRFAPAEFIRRIRRIARNVQTGGA